MEPGSDVHVREGFPGQRMVVLPRPVVRQALANRLTADLIPTDIGFFPRAASHYVDRPAGAAQTIVIYCIRGRGWVEMNGIRRDVQQDQVLVVPAHAPHVYGADSRQPWTIYWFHMAGARVQELLERLGTSLNDPIVPVLEDAGFTSLFEEIVHTLDRGYAPNDLLLASATLAHLLAKLIAWREERGSPSLDERIERVIQYMRQYINGQVEMPELASVANLSVSHFAAVFKRKTGYPSSEYFLRLKMKRAQHLLDTTALPIKIIAARLGFEDPLYFSRRFRVIHGCAPSEYRAISKG